VKTYLIILGSGNSFGTPRIDGHWGNCDKKNKKNLRTRCSAAIIKGKNKILIDTSPDIKTQLITNKIKNVSSVVYTHEHSDQTNGLFELRPFAFKKNNNNKINYWKKNKPINVYGNYQTISLLKKRFDYCFTKIGIYPPIVKANIIKKKFSLGKSKEKINFKTISANHGTSKVTVYIFNKTAYLSDCSDLSIIKEKNLKNLNYMIIDCLNMRGGFAHFGLVDCLHIFKMLKPKKMILTNLHQDLDHNKLAKMLPKNVVPAFDGLKLIL
jgi:phosphoribosyl 1,2-cyclic phosphate phosphodiesterase